MRSLLLGAGLAALASFAPSMRAADYFILPAAGGTGDGSSWADAAAAPETGSWTELLTNLSAGDNLRIGSGTYQKGSFTFTKGGQRGAPITLLGEDTGGGLPVLRGSWVKETPAAGEVFCRLSLNVGFVAVKNLRFQNYRTVVVTEGGNEGITLSGLDVKDVRMGAIFSNNARADDPSTWTRDVLIENCTFTGFTKSALRWEGGNRDFRIVNCHGDAGGKAYANDPFHMIYDIRGDQRKNLPPIIGRVHDNNLTFIGCTARNAWNEGGKGKYWNGDGFVAERGVHDLTFINCMAFDCTDGGWDFKAHDVIMKGCVAFRNKRNVRIWGSATLENCIMGYPVKRGGSGDSANLGVYSQGPIAMINCTLIGDSSPFNIDVRKSDQGGPNIQIKNSLVIADGAVMPNADAATKDAGTLVFAMDAPPSGPVFAITPVSEWDGKGTAFDAKSSYGSRGYHSGRN